MKFLILMDGSLDVRDGLDDTLSNITGLLQP